MAKDPTASKPRFDAGRTYLLKGSTLNALWQAIRGSKPLNGIRQTKDGWQVEGGAGSGGTSLHNFQVTWAGEDGAASTVANGMIGSITPTLDGGDTLDTLPAPTIDLSAAASGTLYVYAVVTATLTVEDGYVTTYTLDEVDITAGASVPTDDNETTWHILLATVTDGVVVTPQPYRTSIPVLITDSGLADGTALLLPGTISY